MLLLKRVWTRGAAPRHLHQNKYARVEELGYSTDLKSVALGIEGSNPSTSTRLS